MEEGLARLCQHAEWVCDEKGLIEAAGLGGVQTMFAQVPDDASGLARWVDAVAESVGAPLDDTFRAAPARPATGSETD